MRHELKKIKFKFGKDANKMMVRKLLINFIKKGQLTTTIKKIKILRSQIDRIVNQAKTKKINQLLKKINDRKLINFLMEKVVPVFTERKSGYTTFKRVKVRLSDGSELAKLTWVKPIIISKKKVKDDNKAQSNKTNQSEAKK